MKKLLMVMVLLPLMTLADTEYVPRSGIWSVQRDGRNWQGDFSGCFMRWTVDNCGSFDGCACITGVTPVSGDLVVPETIDGVEVVSLAWDLYKCPSVTSVTLSTHIKEIGPNSFYKFTGLRSVALNEGLAFIGSKAFRGCKSLTSVTIPSTVRMMEGWVFLACANLKSVTFLGEMPEYDGYLYEHHDDGGISDRTSGIYSDAPNVVTYVTRGKGWDDVVALGMWQGRPIRYVGEQPQLSSLVCVPGEAVSFDTGLIGYTAKGLPSGLKYNKTTGMITGAAKKPTAAEGVTVKFTKKGEADVTMTVVVGPIPTINVTLEGDTEKCKVTGGNKAYLVGKKVSLQAKGPKGTAFVGWFKDGEPWPNEEEFLEPKIKYVMTREDLNLVARFEKEKMSIDASAIESAAFQVGAEVAEGVIVINVETQSGLKTLKATKLPSGLKLKQDKKTGIWSVCGKPKKAGEYEMKLTATAKSGAVEALVVPVTVGEKDSSGEVGPLGKLPEWLVGTYEGWFHDVYYGDVSWDDGVVGEWGGRAMFTVSSSGTVTGKGVGSDREHPIQKAQISRAVDGGFECNVRLDDTACCIVFSKTNVAGRDRGMATANWRHVNKWNEHIESTVVGWQNRWKDGSGNKLSPSFVKGTVMPICMGNMLETCGSRRGLPYGGWLTLKYDKDGSLRTAFSETQGGKATATGSAQMVPYDLDDDGRIKLLTTVVLKPKNREPFALVLDLSVPGEGSISEGDVVVEDYFLSAE